jgi:hypothetical protein
MKLVISYVILARGATLPPQRMLDEAMLSVKERVARSTIDKCERLRLRLIVDDGSLRPLVITSDDNELIVECSVEATEYIHRSMREKAAVLSRAAAAVVDRVLNGDSVESGDDVVEKSERTKQD